MNQDFKHCPLCKAALTLNSDGYLECVSSQCQFIYYQNPTPVVAAIVEYGNHHVILGHNRAWPAKWYGLITGFLEKYEHPHECVIREVKEEIGLDCTIEKFVGHYTFKRMNQIILAFHVIGTGDIVLEDELDDVKIVPFDKVKTWPGGTGKALKDFLEGLGYKAVN